MSSGRKEEGSPGLGVPSSMPSWSHDGVDGAVAGGMDSAHHRPPRYYQRQNHSYYNQYQPQPYAESSSWTLWRDPRAATPLGLHPLGYPRGGPRRRRWCNVLAAVMVFLVILAVMVIAGLAIYMGALKLEVSQCVDSSPLSTKACDVSDLVLDGSFRVVGGDTYNISLKDHSSPLSTKACDVSDLVLDRSFRVVGGDTYNISLKDHSSPLSTKACDVSDLVLDGSFRVVGGDTYNISLKDHSSPLSTKACDVSDLVLDGSFRVVGGDTYNISLKDHSSPLSTKACDVSDLVLDGSFRVVGGDTYNISLKDHSSPLSTKACDVSDLVLDGSFRVVGGDTYNISLKDHSSPLSTKACDVSDLVLDGSFRVVGGDTYNISLKDHSSPLSTKACDVSDLVLDGSFRVVGGDTYNISLKDHSSPLSTKACDVSDLVLDGSFRVVGGDTYNISLKDHSSPLSTKACDVSDLVLDGSFRVVGGDTYNISLKDHSSPLFQRKSHIYKQMIESIFRRTEFSPALKQCSILGFKNGSVVVFFRLILDRRKIPKKAVPVEEQVRAILLQKLPAASPLKNFKVDKTQVFLKRVGENTSQSQSVGDLENQNQSFETYNGLLRKGSPQIITSHYTNTPFSRPQIPKTTSTTTEGVIGGSFKLSEPDQTTKSWQTTSQKPSSQEYQTSQTFNKTSRNNVTSSIDFYQHSPALHALLKHKTKIETSSSTTSPESIEPTLNQDETDLITLLPYIFQGEEEPWKPVLPENFTRYPERRPFATENYSSGGIGVVEVVLDPEDLAPSIHSKPNPSKEDKREKQQYLNLANPVSFASLTSSVKPASNINRKETFGPRSDDKVSFFLNTEADKNEENYDRYEKFHNIFIKHKNNNELKGNISSLSDILPDFPIIQQFHNLDALLRSYSLKSLNHKVDDSPVTLLPARSNLDIRKQIRPRPSPNTSSRPSYDLIELTKDVPKTLQHKLSLKISSMSDDKTSKVDVSAITERDYQNTDTTVAQENNSFEIDSEAPTVTEKVLNLKQSYEISENTEYTKDVVTSTQSEDPTFIQLLNPSTETYETISTVQDTPHETKHSEEIDGIKYVELTTQSKPLSPTGMSFRNNRQSKMSPTFIIGGNPLKFDLQRNPDKVSAAGVGMKTNQDNSNAKNISLDQANIVKLKDVKIQEVLEKIIYNLTSPETMEIPDVPLEQNLKLTDFQNHNLNVNDDPSIALNRKFGQSTADSKNSLLRNSSGFDMKPDVIFYFLKHQNKSSISSQALSYSSSYVKNSNSEEFNKSSPNYVVNKDGFLMLTKVYNKASTSSQTDSELTLQSNTTGNRTTECSGSLKIRCGSGECINSLSRCNHLVDCADGSDEKNCSCAEFLRAQYLTRKICDGVVDCWDFSDENNCEWCSSGQYVCSSSRVCVDQERVCDGHSDCPNGDDEKNCVSIAPDISQADTIKYHTSGTLMIRKEGHWGKLCTQNFDDLNSIFKSRWTLEDLGRVVCKTMTFRSFESIEHVNDSNADGIQPNKFYELAFYKDSSHQQSSRLGLTFGNTNCSEKKVVRVTCGNLECGVRPQAHSPWDRAKRGGSRHSRIVGGGNAGPGSWPWLAALYKEGEFQCGATLISDHWLLSAGHCFYHALDDHWVARLGALRRGTNLPSPYEQLRVVSRILLHPHYVDAGFINDISLLRLREPVTLTNYVRPICLPQPSAALRDGTMCTVIGWGQLFEVGRIFPDTLQEVQLPVISTAECRKRTLFLPLYKVTENMFCAGYDRGGRDACLGDSGGPLMCQESDGHWSLIGVTSNGYGCARANRPGVYTKVANYIAWVQSSMAADEAGAPARRNTSCHGHRCPLGECLPPARTCNGFMECSDGSDEKDCW